MRRVLVLLALVAAAVAAYASGRWHVALAVAGLKTLVVGWEYMELRLAHRLHASAWVALTVTLTATLVALATTRPDSPPHATGGAP
jgi:uncharacterized membrane protein YjjP (DUF1212 family)